MERITLDELIAEVQRNEAKIKEPAEVAQMIHDTAVQIANTAFNNDKIHILTDYDADGICSAFIMEKLLSTIAPDCEVTVECNDRRRAYGLDPEIKGDEESKYIICDMGSNQLDLARQRLGEDVIIIDHHLIESDEIKEQFKDNTYLNQNLCNPHALHNDDSLNAQYCAAGLAFRIYQEIEKEWERQGKGELFTKKQDNTVAIMACIGTATDMVNVLDTNSNNREILKDGLQRIDNADEENLDFIIGNMLAKCKIEDGVTAYQLAFNVGSFINSASRMSEITQENGAQRMYDALVADPDKSDSFKEIDSLIEQNSKRKALVSQLTSEQDYIDFVNEHCFGDKAGDNIGVYQLPDDTPAAFAGLIAGRLAEITDKAIICLSYNSKRETFTGSGRNGENNISSLMGFMKDTLKDSTVTIEYGGHEDAIGISSLNDIVTFKNLVEANASNMKAKDISEKTVLSIAPQELMSYKTVEKLKALEPVGVGLKIPPVILEGKEQYRDKNFISGRDDWKRVKVVAEGVTLSVSDWSYNAKAYPQSGNKNNEIAVLADLKLNNYQGLHTDLTAAHDRAFLAERTKEVELRQSKQNLPKEH